MGTPVLSHATLGSRKTTFSIPRDCVSLSKRVLGNCELSGNSLGHFAGSLQVCKHRLDSLLAAL